MKRTIIARGAVIFAPDDAGSVPIVFRVKSCEFLSF